VVIERGQIFFVFLDPAFGRETGGYKTRPVVVISINDINQKRLPVIVVPGTSAGEKPVHFKNVVRVEPTRLNGLANPTLFQCNQIRAIDQGRFTSTPIGRLSSKDLISVEDAIKYVLLGWEGPLLPSR
jgi:mRNA-degrading endonuclease toxin of MazEF toxin-antitoxin module